MGDIYIGLLGDLTVHTPQGEVPIPSHQQRLTLSLLALNVDRTVSVERIIRALWDDCPPPSARATVRGYVRRLRAALGSGSRSTFEVIASQSGGYRLRADRAETDVGHFRRW